MYCGVRGVDDGKGEQERVQHAQPGVCVVLVVGRILR